MTRNVPFTKPEIREGLDGIVVTETKLSHVDGERGRLVIAGHDVETLAGSRSFEQVWELLLRASEREGGESAGLEEQLARARDRAFARLPSLGDALAQAHGMDALRAAVAHLPESSTRAEIVGSLAVFSAAWSRLRAGLAPIAPPARTRHAEALLAMLGAPADPARARALDAYLVTVIDHGLNASTFAARVVASTGSDLVSAVVAGICALKGPLHGGAPGPVLELLEAIGGPERAREVLERELGAGRRIMGMGHRIYRQRDPRAYVLERAVEELERDVQAGDPRMRARHALARSVEREAEQLLEQRYPGRNLRANVEFYTAVLLSALELPSALFSPLFACARSAGWIAHADEQQRRGRLIRPAAYYSGEIP